VLFRFRQGFSLGKAWQRSSEIENEYAIALRVATPSLNSFRNPKVASSKSPSAEEIFTSNRSEWNSPLPSTARRPTSQSPYRLASQSCFGSVRQRLFAKFLEPLQEFQRRRMSVEWPNSAGMRAEMRRSIDANPSGCPKSSMPVGDWTFRCELISVKKKEERKPGLARIRDERH
jgi:hypothetical protein